MIDLYTQIVAEQRKDCEVCSGYPNYICGYHEAFFDGVEYFLRKHTGKEGNITEKNSKEEE